MSKPPPDRPSRLRLPPGLPAAGLLMTSAIALLVAGCGGGGGGGGGGGAINTGNGSGGSQTVGFTVQPQTAQERQFSRNALGPINAFVPLDTYSIFGLGVVVALFDTGVNATHPDLSGQILTTAGYNEGADATATITTDPDTINTHGTAVSSMIAGIRNVGSTAGNNPRVEGVAPSAKIVPVELPLDNSGDFAFIDDAHLPQAINYINNLSVTVGGVPTAVRIMNNSWNTDVDLNTYTLQNGGTTLAQSMHNSVAAWQSFVNNHGVVVWAAGNDMAAQPGAFAALPLQVPALQPGWVAVVAINPATGTLDTSSTGYSNQCGATAAFCIAAVGGSQAQPVQAATVINGVNTYAGYIGTSFAAPEVSGAIALLMSAPNQTLNAQQALAILFTTANKTGLYATTAIYGNGVLDLNKAMGPVGQTVLPEGERVVSTSASGIALGGAFGAGPAGSLAATPMMVLDSYRRGFYMAAGNLVAAQKPRLDQANGLRVFSPIGSQGTDPRLQAPDGSQSHLMSATMPLPLLDAGVRFGFGVDPGMALSSGRDGAAGAVAADLLAPGALSNPYFGMMTRASVTAVDFRMGGATVTAATATGQPFTGSGLMPVPVNGPQMGGGDVEAVWRLAGGGAIRADLGSLVETGSLLGSVGAGATRLGRGLTGYAGLGGELPVADRLSVVAEIHAGVSQLSGAAGSLFQGAAGVTSYAAGLGLVRTSLLTQGDRVTFDLGLPLRATGGRASLVTPIALNPDGSITNTTVGVPMKADGSELDLQGAWTAPVAPGAEVSLGVLLRRQPDNIRTAAPEGVAAARLSLTF